MHSTIKKYWLISSLVYLIMLLTDSFLTNPLMEFELGLFSAVIIIPFGYLFIEGLNFLALYLFSYKKNGTILLNLNIVLSLVRAFTIILTFLSWKDVLTYYANNPQKSLLSGMFFLGVYFLIIMQWIFFSLKLRKSNKSAIMDEILSDPQLQKSMQELKAVNNSEDLNLKYGECVRSHPQIAKVFKKIYKQRKLELS